MRLPVLTLLVLLPRVVYATCEPGYAQSAVRARITQGTIDDALRSVDALLPDSVTLPDLERTVFECGGWFDDVAIRASGADVRVSVESVDVDLASGAIDIGFSGGLNVGAYLELTLCALPDTACNASLHIDHFAVTARASISVQNCIPTIVVEAVTLNIANEALTANLAGCGLYGTLFNAVHDVVRDALLDYARQQLVAQLPEMLTSRLADVTTGLVERQVTVARLQFSAQPRLIAIDDAALQLDFDLGVTPTTRSSCVDSSALVARMGPDEAPSALPPDQSAIAVSGQFVQNVIDAAWATGWLCFDTRTTDVGIGDILEGTLPGSRVDALVIAQRPPRLVTGDDGGGIGIDVRDLHGELAIRMAPDKQYSATFATDVFVGADVAVRDANRRLVVAPRTLGLGALEVQIGRADINLTRSTMASFVEAAVMPRFLKDLRELPVAANVFTATALAVSIDDVSTSAAGIVAAFSVFGASGSDFTPPTTVAAEEPHCPCGATIELRMASDDDETPDGFIHHLVDIDGVRQDEVHVGESVVLSDLSAGHHTVTLSAKDLSGNVDTTPVTFEVNIDTTAPVIQLRDGPHGIIPASGTQLTVSATDDLSKPENITIDYVIEAVGRRAKDDRQLAAGRLVKTNVLVLGTLPDLSTVRVRFTATDQAGNAASVAQSYAVVDEPGMGCNAAGATTPLVMLAASGLLLRRRRR